MLTLIKNKTVWSYSLAHFSVDICAGALPIIMLYLSQAMQLSIAQSAFVVGIYTMSSSLAQPLFGYLSDKYNSKWQSTLGLAWLAVFQGCTGWASSYPMLLGLVALAGLGSAAFHPHGASGASKSGGTRKTSAMAIFMLGGNSGYATGPIVAGILLESFGVRGSIVISVIGLLLAPLVFFASKTQTTPPALAPLAGASSPTKSSLPNTGFSKLAILALLGIMFLRAWTQAAVTSFLPTYFTQIIGLSKVDASHISGFNLYALALGGLLGGFFADKIGSKRVLVGTFLAYAPLVLALFSLPGNVAVWVAPLAGFVAGASWPPLIVMSQELFPKNAGFASGIALGFAFAMGGIGQSLTGYLADHVLGLVPALQMLAALPVVAACGVGLLPARQKVRAEQTALARA